MFLGAYRNHEIGFGAPVLYQRARLGMEANGTPILFHDLRMVERRILGISAAETTAVIANAPGYLELLHYLANSYVFYGDRGKTYHAVRITIPRAPGPAQPLQSQAYAPSPSQRVLRPAAPSPPTDKGDGTVPEVSGAAPGKRVRKLIALALADHSAAFDNHAARAFTLFSICKVVKEVKR